MVLASCRGHHIMSWAACSVVLLLRCCCCRCSFQRAVNSGGNLIVMEMRRGYVEEHSSPSDGLTIFQSPSVSDQLKKRLQMRRRSFTGRPFFVCPGRHPSALQDCYSSVGGWRWGGRNTLNWTFGAVFCQLISLTILKTIHRLCNWGVVCCPYLSSLRPPQHHNEPW